MTVVGALATYGIGVFATTFGYYGYQIYKYDHIEDIDYPLGFLVGSLWPFSLPAMMIGFVAIRLLRFFTMGIRRLPGSRRSKERLRG